MQKDEVIGQISSAIGAHKVLSGDDLSERPPHVWRPSESLKGKALVLPENTEDVSVICRICNQNAQPIVVLGGLTNLVRSTESTEQHVLVSMERMGRIEEVDVTGRTMTVEAGVILETIQEEARKHDLFFPLNFGAKGSCQVGGFVSTNAGGVRVIRYGMTRNLVIGLEAVLADGTVISSMHKILKNNSGYDLKQLFIGSEGTLGIVTKAVLRLYEAPRSRNSAYVGFEDFESVQNFLKFIYGRLGGRLSAFEFFWDHTYAALTRPDSAYKPPLTYGHNYYVLVEALGGRVENDAEDFQMALESAFEEDLIKDAAIAGSDADLRWFWNIREDIGSLLSLFKYRQDFDISISIRHMEKYIKGVHERLKTELGLDQCFTFGHIADGNIHFVVGKDSDDKGLTHAINEIVYGPLEAIRGSVSAEHGIGIDKKEYLGISRTPAEIDLMKMLKRGLDPKNILNPGKVIDL